MAHNYSDEAYLYASARTRALENRLIGGDRYARLAEARDVPELMRAVEESGYAGFAASPEAAFAQMQSKALDEVCEMTRDCAGDAFTLYRYPYDCHNLKAALKCELRSAQQRGAGRAADPLPLMVDFGTVPPEKCAAAVRGGGEALAGTYPAHMAAAVGEARRAYAQNRDPKGIDCSLDAACYADMLAKAEEYSLDSIAAAIKLRIDLTNLLTAVRMSRMSLAPDRASLGEAFIGGAGLDAEALRTACGDDAALGKLASASGYTAVGEAIAAGEPLPRLEKLCDDRVREGYLDSKYKVAGAEIPASYVGAVETQVKNLRMLLAGKAAGTDSKTLRERLRESYV